MDAFPAFFPLKDRKVVIAGHGEAADAKARLFEGSPATVIRVDAPQAFAPGTYANTALVFIAGDGLFVQAAASAARAARALVNVVDRPELSDFFTPAVIDRGEVVAAVSTSGAAPMLSAMLRNAIEARIPQGSGRVAALLRRHQDEVREAIPEQAARRAFLRDAISGPAAQAAMDGDMDRAGVLLREALANRGEQAGGRVLFVAGRGPADLLTLRASRMLAEADVIAADEGVDPGVLGLARRDAHQLAPGEANVAALAQIAGAGKLVIRLIVAAPDKDDLLALLRQGVSVDVMLAAPEA